MTKQEYADKGLDIETIYKEFLKSWSPDDWGVTCDSCDTQNVAVVDYETGTLCYSCFRKQWNNGVGVYSYDPDLLDSEGAEELWSKFIEEGFSVEKGIDEK